MSVKAIFSSVAIFALAAVAVPAAADGGAYSIYDTDKDGYLSPDEYETFRQSRPARVRDSATYRFENVDTDGDRRISGEEMVELMKSQLKEKLKARGR